MKRSLLSVLVSLLSGLPLASAIPAAVTPVWTEVAPGVWKTTFGQHDFESLKDQPTIGNHTIPAGGSLTLRYRFYLHEGDPEAAKIAEQYAAYAAGR